MDSDNRPLGWEPALNSGVQSHHEANSIIKMNCWKLSHKFSTAVNIIGLTTNHGIVYGGFMHTQKELTADVDTYYFEGIGELAQFFRVWGM